MAFTPEQIAFIDQMITERLKKGNQYTLRPKSYHSIPDLRRIIASNIDGIKKELGDGDFDISVLRHVLRKFTVMRENDNEYLAKAGCTRFDLQVLNAIRSNGWANGCPIESTGRTRAYRFVKSATPFFFEAQ